MFNTIEVASAEAHLITGFVEVVKKEFIVTLQKSGFGTLSVSNDEKSNNKQEIRLMLLEEEAIYLMKIGKLVLYDGQGEVALSSFWVHCLDRLCLFPVKFKVYEHFKTQNFVIRSGINFGVDYCLYRDLPANSHSEFCVSIDYGDPVAWKHLSSLTRIMPDIMKVCLLCRVFDGSVNQDIIDAESGSQKICGNEFQFLVKVSNGRTDLEELQGWQVHSHAVSVRRCQVNNGGYITIKEQAARYEKSSLLRRQRHGGLQNIDQTPQVRTKKRKKRSQVASVRQKEGSKANIFWNKLLTNQIEAQGTDNNTTRTDKM